MSEFITDISLTQFRRLIKELKGNEIKQLCSFGVVADGEHLGAFIIPQTGFIRDSAESLAELSNSAGGKNLKEYLLKLEPVS